MFFLQRQSMIRSKKKKESDGEEESKLQEALEENKRLSEDIEKLKMEHRQQVSLSGCEILGKQAASHYNHMNCYFA